MVIDKDKKEEIKEPDFFEIGNSIVKQRRLESDEDKNGIPMFFSKQYVKDKQVMSFCVGVIVSEVIFGVILLGLKFGGLS